MHCLLLALTGMGNTVLETLLAHEKAPSVTVITRAEPGPYPYYPCEQLTELCHSKGVPCHTDVALRSAEGLTLVRAMTPDVILSATFHQIIPQELIAMPRLGAYNVHPSLLPAYRGPTPTNWAIIRGETNTGLTLHRLTSRPDGGNIVLQHETAIGMLNDGQLRQKLANSTGKLVGIFLGMLDKHPMAGTPQVESEASSFPRLNSEEGRRILRNGHFEPVNLLRGLTPLPGTAFLDQLFS